MDLSDIVSPPVEQALQRTALPSSLTTQQVCGLKSERVTPYHPLAQYQYDAPMSERRSFYSPTSRRTASHDAAHSEEPTAADESTANNPLVPRGPVPLIANAPDLAALLDSLRRAGTFAYDSEFIGELTYVPKLCLIQVATAEQISLIDPLDKMDLTPFWELICDPSVKKIVHAGEQDVEPVIRHLNRQPANLFDTQIAAGFARLAYPTSLSKLVGELTGARLGKGLTFTHWDQRPLSNQQLRYAADDVRYLPAVHAELSKRLVDAGHTQRAEEEFATLCDPARYLFDPETQYLRIRGATSLSPQGLAILRELNILRDAGAREHNIPARSFMRDEVLVDMARSPIKAVEKLAKVRGLPRPVEAEYGSRIVAATQKALSLPASELPPPRAPEPTPSERFAADALFAVIQTLCIGHGIDPGLVTSRQEVSDFHRHLTTGAEPPKRLTTGWRKSLIADPVTSLFKGSGKIALDWQGDRLRANT
jgi:ribonuclease D